MLRTIWVGPANVVLDTLLLGCIGVVLDTLLYSQRKRKHWLYGWDLKGKVLDSITSTHRNGEQCNRDAGVIFIMLAALRNGLDWVKYSGHADRISRCTGGMASFVDCFEIEM